MYLSNDYDYDSDTWPCKECGEPAPVNIGPGGPFCLTCESKILFEATSHPISDINALQVVKELNDFFTINKANYNRWLKVNQIGFGQRYAKRGNAKFPSADYPNIKTVLNFLYQQYHFAWKVKPNVLYLQYLDPGQAIAPHKDPKADLYGTTIGWFGDNWESGTLHGGNLIVNDKELNSAHNRFVHLECTDPLTGKQGPTHSTTSVITGRRYSVIFNYNKG